MSLFSTPILPALSHSRPSSPSRRPGARILAWIALSRQRHGLARLDPHLRADIGLTDGQIHREAHRPLWDVPSNWKSGY